MTTHSADAIGLAAGCSGGHVRRLARDARLAKRSNGKAHGLRFTVEIARAFKNPRQRQAVEKLFTSSAAATDVSSKRLNDSPEMGRERGGAMPPVSESVAGAAADKTVNGLLGWARDRAVQRSEILAHLRAHLGHHGATNSAIDEFAAIYSRGDIAVTEATRAAIESVCARTLKRWHDLFDGGGLSALAGGHGGRAGSGIIDSNPDFREVVLAMIARWPSHLTARWVASGLRARFPGTSIPSNSTIRDFIRRWRRENPSVALAIRNPDRWKGSHRVKIAAAAAAISRLNQEWQIDGTPGDVLLVDGRYHILAVADVYSRRPMFHVAPSEGTQAAARLSCRAMIAWGVPEIIHGDNGKGFVSNYFRRLLDDLDIQYVASPPFRPETKPFVESVIGVMAHELLAMLPGFIGHSVAQRQELRARTSFAARFGAPAQKVFEVKLTAHELQEKLNTWAEHLYGNRVHSGTGVAPNAAAAAWAGEVRRITDERALAILAEEAVARRIGREGVDIAGARSIATAETIRNYVTHIGEMALCFPDPSGDMGRHFLFIDGPRGREFLAIVENVNRLGADRSELAMIARGAQDQFVREKRAEMRRIKNKIKPERIVDEVLEHARRMNEGSTNYRDNSANFAYKTNMLTAAASAVKAITAPKLNVTHDPELIAEGERVLSAIESAHRPQTEQEEWAADWGRYQALRASSDLSTEDANWIVHYKQTPQYQGFSRFDEGALSKTG